MNKIKKKNERDVTAIIKERERHQDWAVKKIHFHTSMVSVGKGGPTGQARGGLLLPPSRPGVAPKRRSATSHD